MDAPYQTRVHHLLIGYGCALPDTGSSVIYKIWISYTRPGFSSYLKDMDALYQTRVQQLLKGYGYDLPDPGSAVIKRIWMRFTRPGFISYL
jgi:hypothetical protein